MIIIEKTTYSKKSNTLINRFSSYNLLLDVESAINDEVESAERSGRTIAVLSHNDAYGVVIEKYTDYYELIVFSNTTKKGDAR